MTIKSILDVHCVACHGMEKHKGGLRVDTLEELLTGGEGGHVIKPGNAPESLLLKRMLLPLDNEDHMPPFGKPQLQPEEINALSKWIEAGASSKGFEQRLHGNRQ